MGKLRVLRSLLVAKTLTVKEAKLVKAKAQGKTHAVAYKEAGYSLGENNPDKVARVNASKVLAKPHVQDLLQKELKKQGITIEAVVKPIAEGLVAEKVSIVGNGDQAMAEITPDHNVRIKSSQIASKWLGLEQEQGGTTVNLNFNNIAKQDKDNFGI